MGPPLMFVPQYVGTEESYFLNYVTTGLLIIQPHFQSEDVYQIAQVMILNGPVLEEPQPHDPHVLQFVGTDSFQALKFVMLLPVYPTVPGLLQDTPALPMYVHLSVGTERW